MKLNTLQEIVGSEPLFETGLLLAGDVDPASVRRQLSRLTASGRIIQVRRGLYALAPPHRKVVPHPFVVANNIVRSSYVSFESALAFYGLIPEHVPMITSVTTDRPGSWNTHFGKFHFHHVKIDFFFGYRSIDMGQGQAALVASPEKALLDLLYFKRDADNASYLKELRLQNLELLNIEELKNLAERSGMPKLTRAARTIREMARIEDEEYEAL